MLGAACWPGPVDRVGLAGALSEALGGLRERRGGDDPGRVIRDLAVMLADGGDCLSDLRAVRDQSALFGRVASDSTAFRLIEKACTPGLLDALDGAHGRAREHVWKLTGPPGRVTIDLDATLLTCHADKEGAAGNFKGGYGFHPMLAYCDETREALAAVLRAGNAGANSAADQITVAETALAQIPGEQIETIEVLGRVDFAGASHELLDRAKEANICFSVGLNLRENVRARILEIPDGAWVTAVDQDGLPRGNGQVCELNDLDLSTWPAGSRVIVRRERADPGAQLSFTDHDGHRFQAILTDQANQDIALLECHRRARARVEDQIRNDKQTGLAHLPFRDFEHNRVWLKRVQIAHDLLVWTQSLLLTGRNGTLFDRP